ncbi:MAG TPA: hypothetical protein VHL14_01220 [Steroidobacteraceae bacterium]|jgi:hypothetical protein|nr:hypothetical protein [Steroidobacteraceae bacterium]
MNQWAMAKDFIASIAQLLDLFSNLIGYASRFRSLMNSKPKEIVWYLSLLVVMNGECVS